ncbi:AAT family amino acid transporter [Fusarium oxysporum f. sp. conglutinans race 2 54008]|uniref:AAT family amino acid transporter n=1 Tax=Fusarium oxysporum f. sp. conglutinans race 2 54008 TaxID=1089457 RepID=X0GW38_FUSOX|nr:AAT family amino acid transporter [Fusarium oxysporum f. sp. conglutinans race 2 54008]
MAVHSTAGDNRRGVHDRVLESGSDKVHIRRYFSLRYCRYQPFWRQDIWRG